MKEILKPNQHLRKLLQPQKVQRGVEYVPSQFALPFTQNEKHYVFHTLTKQCVEAELPAFCTAGIGYDDLIAGYFLVPKGKDECAFYENVLALMKASSKRGNTRIYTILPTFSCNARCVYCFEEGAASTTMTPETAEQTIRYIVNAHRPEEHVLIRWFGGEPLLGERFIDRISLELKKERIPYSSTMTSNGSMITPAIVEKMKGLWNLKSIQISMDGAEDDYRSRKRYCVYHDEYHTVMDAVSQMSAAGIQVAIRCNVDGENLTDIPRFLEDLQRGVVNKGNVSVYFAPLYEERFGGDNLRIWEKVLEMNPLIESAGFKLHPYREMDLSFRVVFCIADLGSSVIWPDGSLYPCEYFPLDEKNRFGDVWNGVTDPEAQREFCRMDRVRGKCRKCAFLPLCTPFASCPLVEENCREIKQFHTIHTLRRLVTGTEQREPDATELFSDC